MSECEKECVFNSNNECWLACKNKFYNQALEDFVKECSEYKDLTFSEEHIERIKMIAEQLKR